MCGITGMIDFSGNAMVTEELVTAMRDELVHRGPDGGETWVSDDRRIGLGFRRLAIIDLSDTAMQPLTNEDGSLRLVFNGEIYNHAELRRELEQCGHRFITNHADGEVIVHAFEEWGIDCLQRFRGMWALAIWDSRARELWLARDRIGIKPLYVSVHHGRLTFASEIKALLRDPQQERKIDEQSLFHYLSFLTTPAPRTLFAGIDKLPGGTWLRITENGDLRSNRYWDVFDHTSPLSGVSEEEIAEGLLERLRVSVAYRKVSDVPVGVFLSGGIDSSVNATLFSEGESGPVKTFSIGYEGEYASYANEFAFAQLVAKRIGSEHYERRLTQDDLIDFLPRMVQLQDEPIADPVCVPVYYLSKLARDNGVIVAQVGEGSDELFWGYPSWKTVLRLARADDLPVPHIAKRAGVALATASGRGDGRAVEYLRRGSEGLPIFWGGAEAFTQAQKQRLLSPRLRRSLDGLTSWDAIEPIYGRFEAGAWEHSHLQWMSYIDLNLRLPELLLMRVDKMSMGVSLEARVPFLDHEFVAYAMSIPESVKTNGGSLKDILKKAVRGLIPDEVIDRPKQGFGVPVYEWIFERLGDEARTELSHFCDQTDLLDRAEVMRYLDNHSGGEVWYMLNLALWWKEFIA